MDNKMMMTLSLDLDLDDHLDSGYNTAESTPLDSPSSTYFLDWESRLEDVDRLLMTTTTKTTWEEEKEDQDVDKKDDDITFTMPPQPFVTGTVTKFHLMRTPAEDDDKGRMTTTRRMDLDKKLSVTIVGPSGHHLPILRMTNLWDRVASSFKPLLPGNYTINATVNAAARKDVVVRGTPAIVTISRDYFSQPLRRIVSWDMDKETKPWGICNNPKTEQIWITDREKNEIVVYAADGTLDMVIGRQGQGGLQFWRPTGLAFDPNSDRMFVTDKDNHRVVILSSTGQFLGIIGGKGQHRGQFLYPWGIAVSPDGSTIAVVDTRNHRIQFFDAAGRYLRHFEVCDKKNWKDNKHLWNYPRGITFNLNGKKSLFGLIFWISLFA